MPVLMQVSSVYCSSAGRSSERLTLCPQAQPSKVRIKARESTKYEEKLFAKAQVISNSANKVWRKSDTSRFPWPIEAVQLTLCRTPDATGPGRRDLKCGLCIHGESRWRRVSELCNTSPHHRSVTAREGYIIRQPNFHSLQVRREIEEIVGIR